MSIPAVKIFACLELGPVSQFLEAPLQLKAQSSDQKKKDEQLETSGGLVPKGRSL
jgi:hypothetical protein